MSINVANIVFKEPPVLFMPGLAHVIGVYEAILYQHITIQVNREGVIVEGAKVWKCSAKNMQSELYYLEMGTLKRTLENLIRDGLIIKRMDESDRTNCYSTNEERLEHLYELSTRKRSLSQKRADARSKRGVLPHEDPSVQNEPVGFLILNNGLVQNEPPHEQHFTNGLVQNEPPHEQHFTNGLVQNEPMGYLTFNKGVVQNEPSKIPLEYPLVQNEPPHEQHFTNGLVQNEPPVKKVFNKPDSLQSCDFSGIKMNHPNNPREVVYIKHEDDIHEDEMNHENSIHEINIFPGEDLISQNSFLEITDSVSDIPPIKAKGKNQRAAGKSKAPEKEKTVRKYKNPELAKELTPLIAAGCGLLASDGSIINPSTIFQPNGKIRDLDATPEEVTRMNVWIAKVDRVGKPPHPSEYPKLLEQFRAYEAQLNNPANGAMREQYVKSFGVLIGRDKKLQWQISCVMQRLVENYDATPAMLEEFVDWSMQKKKPLPQLAWFESTFAEFAGQQQGVGVKESAVTMYTPDNSLEHVRRIKEMLQNGVAFS